MTELDEIVLAVLVVVGFMVVLIGPSLTMGKERLYPEIKREKEPPGPSSEEIHLKRMRANNPMPEPKEKTVKLPEARVVTRP